MFTISCPLEKRSTRVLVVYYKGVGMIRKKYWVLIAVFAFFVLFASATLYADDAVKHRQ